MLHVCSFITGETLPPATYLQISLYKNESLFPLVTASHVNGWTDLADSFFIVFVNVRRKFILNKKIARKTRKFHKAKRLFKLHAMTVARLTGLRLSGQLVHL